MRAVRQLPFSVDPVVEDRASSVRLGLDFRAASSARTEPPLVLMTQRSRLDAFLAEQAAAAGADFRDGARIGDLSCSTTASRRTLGGHKKVAANWLVCADGVERHRELARSASTTAAPTALLSKPTSRTASCPRRNTAAGSSSSSRTSPAATAGCSRRGITSTSASAAGSARGRGCASTSRGSVASTGFRSRASRTSAATASLYYTRARDSPRDARRCSATRPGSSTRSRATASTRRSCRRSSRPRRSSPATSPRTTASSAGHSRPSWRRRGARRSRSTAFPRLTYAVVRTPFLWKAVESLIGGDVPSPSAMRGLRRASMRMVETIARAAGNPGKALRPRET